MAYPGRFLNMSIVSVEVAPYRRHLVELLAERLELCEDDARTTIDHLIRSEQFGKHDHGLIRVHYLITSGKFGPYGKRPAPTPENPAPGHLHVDGSGYLGYPVIQNIIEPGCEVARKFGICKLSSSNIYPSGALVDWANQVTAQNIVLIMVASNPPRVAAPGGKRPVVGTNPICIGFPTKPMPFIADSSTSAITHGELLLSRSKKTPLPASSAVGPDGHMTTCADDVDPSKGIGAILPAGDSNKFFALAMGIELLVSLGGSSPGNTQAGGHGIFCLLIDPHFLSEASPPISQWLSDHADAGLRIPGWNSYARFQEQQSKGIVEISPETYRLIESL